jgi:hypothetical protein
VSSPFVNPLVTQVWPDRFAESQTSPSSITLSPQ